MHKNTTNNIIKNGFKPFFQAKPFRRNHLQLFNLQRKMTRKNGKKRCYICETNPFPKSERTELHGKFCRSRFRWFEIVRFQNRETRQDVERIIKNTLFQKTNPFCCK